MEFPAELLYPLGYGGGGMDKGEFKRRSIGFWALVGAPALALLVLLIAGFLVSALIAFPLVFIGAGNNGLIWTIHSIVVSFISFWVSRRSVDLAFRDYSGRGVFIFFLCISLLFGFATLLFPHNIFYYLEEEAKIAGGILAAYIQFWRRDLRVESGRQPLEGAPSLARALTPLAPVFGAIPSVLFFLYGLVQLWAVSAQLERFLHLPRLLAFIAALFVTYIPLIGGIIGFFGAKDAWGWQWWQAALLTFGPLIAIFALSVVASVLAATAAGAKRVAGRT
jgi:hypothetical protein